MARHYETNSFVGTVKPRHNKTKKVVIPSAKHEETRKKKKY